MTSRHPTLADRLRRAREDAGLTQQQVADWLGIRRPGVVEIETGRRGVKSEEIVRLAALYGRSVSWLAQGESADEDLLSAALFRAGASSANAVLRQQAHALARRCALLSRIEATLKPRTSVAVPRYEDEAVLGDQTQSHEHGRAVAYQERQRLGLGLHSPLRDAWGVVESAGLRVLLLQLGRDHPVDGIFARMQDGRACVGVNVDKWVFRQVFTVVHEYGHALMDRHLQSEFCETSRGWQPGDRRYANRELRANQFAAVFLVPREALAWYLEQRGMVQRTRAAGARAIGLAPIELVRAQDHFGVSSEMLLWRMQNERLIDASTRHSLQEEIRRQGVIPLARSLGYDWRTRAQPFTRAHELALAGYAKGLVSLGGVADIFGVDKSEMFERLRTWGIHQELEETDALVGQPG